MYRDQTQAFRSSHWDEPNVIAHARMNDRDVPDANGDPKRTLFLEGAPLGSDWHQKGRKGAGARCIVQITADAEMP